MKQRIEYLDIFRAVGIVLMIMGHVGFGKVFNFYIHAFHMPMFFLLSGYFFKSDEKVKDFFQKKIKTLIIPYIFFGIMHYILYCIINKGLEIQSLKHLLFVNTDGLPIAGALWFLTALFFADMFYYFISRPKKIYKVLLVTFISVFGNIATLILLFRLPFALDVACVGVGLMYIGGLIKSYRQNKYVDKILNINIFWGIVIAMISAILIKANSYVNMRKGEYGIIPLFWINAVLSSFVIFVVSKYIDKYCFKWLKQYAVGIGKDSIAYLCLN